MGQLIDSLDKWALIKLVGGLAVVISAVVGFLASLLRDFLANRTRASQEKELETLKHQFSNAEMLLKNLAASGTSAYLSTTERRLDHYQRLWDAMMSIKKIFPTLAFTTYSILNKDEIVNLPSTANPNMRAAIAQFQPDKYFDTQFDINSMTESSRPFVGQHAWNTFFSYQALHGRLVFLLQDGLARGKVAYWIDDRSFLEQVVGISVEPENLSKLLANPLTAFHNVRNYLELQIANEVEALTTGRAAIKETVRQAEDLTKAMSGASSGRAQQLGIGKSGT